MGVVHRAEFVLIVSHGWASGSLLGDNNSKMDEVQLGFERSQPKICTIVDQQVFA